MVEKKIKKWISSKVEDLTLSVSIKDQDKFVMIHQYKEENVADGEVILVPVEKFNDFMEQLGEVRDHINRSKWDNVIIDEVDFKSFQTEYKRSLAYYYAYLMWKSYHDVLRKNCLGCIEDQPNQLAHSCLSPESDAYLIYFKEILDCVDEVEANELAFDYVQEISPITFNEIYVTKETLINDDEWMQDLQKNYTASMPDHVFKSIF